MKGTIFTLFQELVEEEFGFDTWESILDACELESKGIYTSVLNYPDHEIVQLVTALSEQKSIPIPDLLNHFGNYLFPHLHGSLPAEMTQYDNLRDFLHDVDKVIHVEVRKLDSQAITPTLTLIESGPKQFRLLYQSERKFCFLAIGLLQQAAKHFGSEIEVKHRCCMLEGADVCDLVVNEK